MTGSPEKLFKGRSLAVGLVLLPIFYAWTEARAEKRVTKKRERRDAEVLAAKKPTGQGSGDTTGDSKEDER